MDINFELYKAFYHVAKTLSFSAAAHQLFISQSAVSQSIKQLEEKLNTKLFIRHTKQVHLTQEGDMLMKHIEQAYNLIKTGERSIQEIHSLQQGEVRIGASDTTCKYFLLHFIQKFHLRYPQVRIQIINRPSPVCIELLRNGSVDISVINMPQQCSHKNIRMEPLREIQDVFIVGKGYQHLTKQPLSLKELSQYPLLLLEKNSTTRNFFDELMERYGVAITPEIELGSMDLIVDLVKIGLGFSFVMKEVVENHLLQNDIFILDILEEIPARKLGVITNSSIPTSPAAERLLQLFFEEK